MRPFFSILILLGALILAGCSNSSSQGTNLSSVAKITGFALSHDSVPELRKTEFKVLELKDTGLIYNPDSITFGTPIDSVAVTFKYLTIPGSVVMRLADSVVVIRGVNDTLDFTIRPAYITVYSADGTSVKTYQIDVRIHQVDPDLYVWEQLQQSIYAEREAEQQLLELDGRLMLYVGDGVSTMLYASDDKGRSWSKLPMSGSPAVMYVRQILRCESALYYAAADKIYTTTDGQNWTELDMSAIGKPLQTMVWAFPGENGQWCPWMLTGNADDSHFMLGYLDAGNNWVKYTDVERAQFPIGGFSVVNFASASDRSRVLLIGGYSADGDMINNRWTMEYSAAIGLRLTDYARQQPEFPCVANSSVVAYNNRLLLFGAQDRTMKYIGREVFYSIDEGMSWSEMDSTKCQLPATYTARKNVTSIVSGDHVFVVGGADNTRNYSDVYCGKIQSINWTK